jgi:hypothetical protein
MLKLPFRKTKKSSFCLEDYNQTLVPAAYSLRNLKSKANRAIRARADTTDEIDIGFSGQNFDNAGLLNWLSRDLLLTTPLGTDRNLDGISDGWTHSNGTGITSTPTIDTSSQIIEITASTSTNLANVYKVINCEAGNNWTVNCTIKTSGNVKATINIIWYTITPTIISTSSTTATAYADFTAVQLTATAPATAKYGYVVIGITPNSNGDVGSGWFKLASASISNQSCYVKTWYEQSGNGNHATQSTAGNQPMIVNAGVLVRDFDYTKASALYPSFMDGFPNIVNNGNFPSATTNWTAVGGSLSASSGTCLNTVNNGQASYGAIRQNMNTVSGITSVKGKRYFLSVKAKVVSVGTKSGGGNITPSYFDLSWYDGTTITNVALQNTVVVGTEYTLQGVVTLPATLSASHFYLYCYFSGQTTADTGTTFYIDDAYAIDITDLGKPAMQQNLSSGHTTDVLSIGNGTNLNITTQPLMLNAVYNCNTAGYIISRNSTSSTVQYDLYHTSSTLDLELQSNTARDTQASPLNVQEIGTGTWDSNVPKIFINGICTAAGANYNGSLTDVTNTQIGGRSTNADGTAWSTSYKGYISELIIIKDTNPRSKIEKNQGKYYQIGVS